MGALENMKSTENLVFESFRLCSIYTVHCTCIYLVKYPNNCTIATIKGVRVGATSEARALSLLRQEPYHFSRPIKILLI